MHGNVQIAMALQNHQPLLTMSLKISNRSRQSAIVSKYLKWYSTCKVTPWVCKTINETIQKMLSIEYVLLYSMLFTFVKYKKNLLRVILVVNQSMNFINLAVINVIRFEIKKSITILTIAFDNHNLSYTERPTAMPFINKIFKFHVLSFI